MRARFLPCCALLLFAPALSAGRSSEAWLALADRAWAQRAQPGKAEEAIGYWENALQVNRLNPRPYVQLARAAGRVYRQSKGAQERKRWAAKAREYGAKAVESNPTDSRAYAAYAEALGQWAQANKGVRSLGAVKEAVKNLQKAIELNPNDHFAHMLIAQFYEKSPRGISVGDKTKALEHAQRAVALGPAYAINHLTLAEVLLDRGEKEKARAELETVLRLSPPSDAIPETQSDQQKAQAMLKDL